MSVAQTLDGVVEDVNDRGLRVHGTWFNVSKFKPVELPAKGTHILLEVDAKNWIVSIQPQHTSGVATQPSASTSAVEAQEWAPHPLGRRLTVLQAAAQFAAGRADIKSVDVLRIADCWLLWLDGAKVGPRAESETSEPNESASDAGSEQATIETPSEDVRQPREL